MQKQNPVIKNYILSSEIRLIEDIVSKKFAQKNCTLATKIINSSDLSSQTDCSFAAIEYANR